MKRIICIFIAFLLCISTQITFAATTPAKTKVFYVSPMGSDQNSGKSKEQPWKTPQHAADMAKPGDTIYFMSGNYTNTVWNAVMKVTTSGTPDAWITFAAYPGEKPVFKYNADKVWHLLHIYGANYIVIDGLTVEGIADQITHEEAMASYQHAISAEKKDWGYVAKHNTNGISIEGIEKEGKYTHHVTVKNCIIKNNAGAGIASTGGCDYITIENNEVYDNCSHMMYGGSGISFLTHKDIDDNKNEYKSIIRNNVVYRNKTLVPWNKIQRLSDGNGIIVDSFTNTASGPAYKGKTLVANNIAYENGGSGIHTFHSANVDIINNTAVNNNVVLDWGQIFTNQSQNVNLLNNILYTNKVGVNLGSSKQNEADRVTIAHNIYYGGGEEKVRAYMGVNDIIADPMFVDVEKYDFRLKDSSPAIDNGTDVLAPKSDLLNKTRPQGNFTDIGAYESELKKDSTADRTKTLELASDTPYVAPEVQPALEAEALKGTPTIDGVKEELWDNTQKIVLSRMTEGAAGSIKADCYAMWDETALYVLMDVKDPVLKAENIDAYQQDSVEIFIDEKNDKAKKYDSNDTQNRISFENKVTGGTNFIASNIISKTSITDTGYIVEAKFLWRELKPTAKSVIGFELQVNDDPGTGVRENIVNFNDDTGGSWGNTTRWGILKLLDKITKKELNTDTIWTTIVDGDNFGGDEPSEETLEKEITVKIDGVKVKFDVEPTIIEGRTMVPMRKIFELLECSVIWNESDKSVIGTKDSTKIKLKIGEKSAYINDEEKVLDVPAIIIDGRTLVPLRFIGESLSCTVNWIQEKSTVEIKTY